MSLKVTWIDRHREPQHPPHPAFPEGVDLDLSQGAETTCGTDLECPAPRCGFYAINCTVCGLSIMITTAGRADDPRHIRVACKTKGVPT